MDWPQSKKRSNWDIERSEEATERFDTDTTNRLAKRKRTPLRSGQFEVASAAVPTFCVNVPPRTAHPPLRASRSVYNYERLNQIEEGSYGVVYRARDKETGDIVALKKFKLDEEKYGFPITALREINALMACRHENVVNIREIVVGDTLTQWALFFNNKPSQDCAQSVHSNGFCGA
jgi:cell division cycle 2-like protein